MNIRQNYHMRDLTILGKSLNFIGHQDQYLDHLSNGGENFFSELFLRGLIEKKSTIIDVGANIGYVSAVFSIANPEAKV